jgi:hypothetical protein
LAARLEHSELAAGTTLDVGVANAVILDMPVELGLELVAIVCAYFADAEWELFDDMIDEVDRVGLCVLSKTLSALTLVASSVAVYWNCRIFSPRFPMKVRNLTSIWI